MRVYLYVMVLSVIISIVSHGNSTPKAIMNSIFVAQKSIKENLIQDISKGIDEHLGAIS